MKLDVIAALVWPKHDSVRRFVVELKIYIISSDYVESAL